MRRMAWTVPSIVREDSAEGNETHFGVRPKLRAIPPTNILPCKLLPCEEEHRRVFVIVKDELVVEHS